MLVSTFLWMQNTVKIQTHDANVSVPTGASKNASAREQR